MPLDDYAYSNHLRDIHPGEKLAFTLITMGISFIPNLYANGATIFLMACISIFIAGVPAKAYIKLLALPLAFLTMGLLSLVISIGTTESALVTVPFFGTTAAITQSNLKLAVHMFFKSMAMVSCLYFLSATTPILDVIQLLRRLKVPALFLELMLIIYRYIFVLSKAAENIYTSQSSRLGHRTFKASLSSLGKLVSSLFIKSFTDAQKLYISLVARGYDGDLKVLEGEFSISAKRLLLMGFVDTILLLIAIKTGGSL
jgi:cobalt/nickel transport system permease protein